MHLDSEGFLFFCSRLDKSFNEFTGLTGCDSSWKRALLHDDVVVGDDDDASLYANGTPRTNRKLSYV